MQCIANIFYRIKMLILNTYLCIERRYLSILYIERYLRVLKYLVYKQKHLNRIGKLFLVDKINNIK